MSRGTRFHFVTDGIADAFALAREAADGKDIRLGGGVAIIREYLREDSSMRCAQPTHPYSLARENAYMEVWICPPLDIR
jgi:dihydrofolate reductase